MKYHAKHTASMKLQIGAKTPPDLKLHDRKSDVDLGKIYDQQINVFFELPDIDNRSTIFFRAIEIADLMFSLSVLEHGRITNDMEEEAKRAMCAYLECYIPKNWHRDSCRRLVNSRSYGETPHSGNNAPPSTINVWPVTYDAASDARKAIANAMSLGLPNLFMGIRLASFSACARSPKLSAAEVSIIPGSTPFTVTLYFASSSAAARMNPFIPAFDAA